MQAASNPLVPSHIRFFLIYMTFILGTALLNFGSRANNMGHGLLDFCRVKANFWARVPKILSEPRPPQKVVSARLKRGPRAETGGIFVPRVFALMTDHEGEGSGIKNKLLGRQNLVPFAGRKTWRREMWKNLLLEQRRHKHVNRLVVGGN